MNRNRGKGCNGREKKQTRSAGAVSIALAALLVLAPFRALAAGSTGQPSMPEQTAQAEQPAEAGQAEQPEEKESVSVHLAGEPGDPVPGKVMDTDTASLLKQVSEGLVTLDESGEPVPGSAEKWKVSEDGLRWEFTLRDDLRWADGEEMDASDFEALFRKVADPTSEALYGSDLTGNIAPGSAPHGPCCPSGSRCGRTVQTM